MVNFGDILKNEFFQFVSIILGSYIISRLFHFIFIKYIKKIAKKTKSDIDDVLIAMLEKPIHFIILFLGIYFGLKSLSIISTYFDLIDKINYVLIVLVIAYILSRALAFLIARWLKVKKRFDRTPKLLSKVVTVVIYIVAILMILTHYDVEITPLIATLGIGGLAIGLALQNTLSNFFAGLHIISDQPINVGDFIEIEDGKVSGYVDDIGWRSTRIKTLPNTIIVIPNSKLAESIITNDSMPQQEMAALVQVGVSYNSDLKKVEKVTIDVAKKIQKTVPGAVKDFEPFIRYHTFADSNINFTVILRVEKFVDKYLVTHEFIKALKERYDKEKIEISWPVRKIVYSKKR